MTADPAAVELKRQILEIDAHIATLKTQRAELWRELKRVNLIVLRAEVKAVAK